MLALLVLLTFSAFAENRLREAAATAAAITGVVSSSGIITNCQSVHPRHVRAYDENVRPLECPHGPPMVPSSSADMDALIAQYGIELWPDASIKNTPEFQSFIFELRKFPVTLMNELRGAGARIRAVKGVGVTDDPTWNQQRDQAIANLNTLLAYNAAHPENVQPVPTTAAQILSDYERTADGRTIRYLSGKGGDVSTPSSIFPTRIVINALYRAPAEGADGRITMSSQGAVNLFLHEHAHTLDTLYGNHRLSQSRQFREAISTPQASAYIAKITSDYETDPTEGFAELFAYYHSCDEARQQMEREAPGLAQLFRGLTNVREFLARE